jgi:FixJ family two-component response regulator
MNKTGITVCLVDDDALVLRSAGRLLSGEGWRVETFCDPRAFLIYAKTHQPRVAIIDIIMPIMNGLEVQRLLRDISPLTQVIVLTSKDDPMVRFRAFEAGAAAFFLKPAADVTFLKEIEIAAASSNR